MRSMISVAAVALLHTALLSPAAAQSGFQWFNSIYLDQDPFQSQVYLFHGIPETDATQLVAQCVIGAGGTYVVMDLGANVGNYGAGQVVDVQFVGSGFNRILTGEIIRAFEVGITGVSLAIEVNDPLWDAIEDLSILYYNLTGFPSETLSLRGSATPTRQFLNACRGGLVPTAAPPPVTTTTPKPGGLPPPNTGAPTCASFGALRSTDGGAPATITFINSSNGYRAIMWIDYSGTPQFYGGLNPGESFQQQTVVGHPWMITDGPGNCLEIYLPPPGQSFYTMSVTGGFGPE